MHQSLNIDDIRKYIESHDYMVLIYGISRNKVLEGFL